MATTQPQVLKSGCSLVGKSLTPVFMRMRAADPDVQLLEFSRLDKDQPLENLSKAELITEFEKLTGNFMFY